MIRRMLSIIAPVIAVWVVLIAFGFWRDADWPEDRLLQFITLSAVASFVMLVSTLMLRRMHGRDWLTISLAVAFASLAVIPFYLMAVSLWREFYLAHRDHMLYAACAAMLIPLAWATVMLLITPDGSYAADQRAEGVIEGRAEGVAQEQHDQHVREGAA